MQPPHPAIVVFEPIEQAVVGHDLALHRYIRFTAAVSEVPSALTSASSAEAHSERSNAGRSID